MVSKNLFPKGFKIISKFNLTPKSLPISRPIFLASPFDPKYVKSVHFLVGRNVSGYRFPPSCLRAERKKAEAMLKTALEALTGTFISLVRLSKNSS